MTTNHQEFERRYRDYAEIMFKLDEGDLQSLAFIFECYPHHISPEIRKEDYIESLWSKIRDQRRYTEDLHTLREALRTIGCR